jgi:hypothetical protein
MDWWNEINDDDDDEDEKNMELLQYFGAACVYDRSWDSTPLPQHLLKWAHCSLLWQQWLPEHGTLHCMSIAYLVWNSYDVQKIW